jgi:hypothetical protein
MDRIQIRIRIGWSWKVIRIRQTFRSDLIRIHNPVTNVENTFMARKFWTLLCTKSIQGSLLLKYREGIWSAEKRRKNTENMLPELITAIEIISRGYLYLLHYKIKLLKSSAEPSLDGISIKRSSFLIFLQSNV